MDLVFLSDGLSLILFLKSQRCVTMGLDFLKKTIPSTLNFAAPFSKEGFLNEFGSLTDKLKFTPDNYLHEHSPLDIDISRQWIFPQAPYEMIMSVELGIRYRVYHQWIHPLYW